MFPSVIKMENTSQIVDGEPSFADLDSWMLSANFYVQDIAEKDEVQSVPDQEPSIPFSNYNMTNNPALNEVPLWMNNFNQFTDLKTNNPAPVQYGLESELSPAPSSTESFFTDGESMESSVDKHQSDENFKKIIARLGVSEKKIQEYSVKELNRFLKSNGLSKEEQTCLKNRRRTLKNRGYAQNCRIKRIKVKKSLEEENEALKAEIEEARQSLAHAMKERDVYKRRLHKIADFFKAQKNPKAV